MGSHIPPAVRTRLIVDPFMKICVRKTHDPTHVCAGRITFEHALIYQGRQLQEWWSIIPLCELAHLGSDLVKSFNVWVALSRAPAGAFLAYPRSTWGQEKKWLEKRYGLFKP